MKILISKYLCVTISLLYGYFVINTLTFQKCVFALCYYTQFDKFQVSLNITTITKIRNDCNTLLVLCCCQTGVFLMPQVFTGETGLVYDCILAV